MVGDDPQTPQACARRPLQAGYAPIVTGDPEEALRVAGEYEPQLVLLDLMLPGTDGIELMETIRETVDAPVIFLSAYRQEEVIDRAIDRGAADYVVKPFAPTELAARIRAVLRGGTATLRPEAPLRRGRRCG